MVERDLEKATTKHTQKSTRSARPGDTPQTAQEWDGEDDQGMTFCTSVTFIKVPDRHNPDDPRNWSLASKVYHVLVPALQCFKMYAAA